MKGEFENRLKSVSEETKACPKPIILFIDEAHALIGAGSVLLYGHTGIAVAIGEAKT
ncbi:MAG: type secretion system protein VasG [Rhodospirillaceae bacterium]|nr:type secretion system protein VasG [Rhodospirillaceae bacterium]